MNTYNTFSKLIYDNEKILWYGKSSHNISGAFAVVFAIIWFVVSILILVPIVRISLWMLFIAIPFCLIEAIFIERADRLYKKDEYCVTDSRLIIKKASIIAEKNLIDVKAITLEKINKEQGSLVFEELKEDKKSSYGDFRFYSIENYVLVYKFVSDARDKKRKLTRGEQ